MTATIQAYQPLVVATPDDLASRDAQIVALQQANVTLSNEIAALQSAMATVQTQIQSLLSK